MLVIARKAGESIRIADQIEVVVLAVDGHRVRLGIKAPREVKVLRTELEQQVAGTNQGAAVRKDGDTGSLLEKAAAKLSRPVARPAPPPVP